MTSHRVVLVSIVSASLSVLAVSASVAACATADLIEAPEIDAGPYGVVSESGTGDATDAASDAAPLDAASDTGASDAANPADAGETGDAASPDASHDASSQG